MRILSAVLRHHRVPVRGLTRYPEGRQYDVLRQMTRIAVTGLLDQEYAFPYTQDYGRIWEDCGGD